MLECHWWNSGQRRRSPCDTFESPSDGNQSPCDGIAKVLMTFRPSDYVPTRGRGHLNAKIPLEVACLHSGILQQL